MAIAQAMDARAEAAHLGPLRAMMQAPQRLAIADQQVAPVHGLKRQRRQLLCVRSLQCRGHALSRDQCAQPVFKAPARASPQRLTRRGRDQLATADAGRRGRVVQLAHIGQRGEAAGGVHDQPAAAGHQVASAAQDTIRPHAEPGGGACVKLIPVADQ